ncbi:MAG: desulfoferrodoxin [Patescibacteria group bacterium]|nr:desulfoferrodoxin [Patescibacteria group bacterium]
MTKQNEIYKCDVCGNIVEVLHIGAGELVCCGQPMGLAIEKTEDDGQEKHVPVISELESNAQEGKGGVIVKVGEVEHPMSEDHFIEWIEIIVEDNKRGKKFLKPGDKPEVEFYTSKKVMGVRAYCNIHGLWGC